jgi:hypothetical protein
MSAVPTVAAAHWLYETLTGSQAVTEAATGGVWENPAPAHVDAPFVSFELLDAGDTLAVGASRILGTARYIVRVIGSDVALSELADAATAIDDALHGASGTVSEGIVAGCVRERPFQMAEHSGGITYRHLGGVYRVVVA